MSFIGFLQRAALLFRPPPKLDLSLRQVLAVGIMMGSHGIYTAATKTEMGNQPLIVKDGNGIYDKGNEPIIIKEKYILPSGMLFGSTLMVVDSKNEHYQMANSLWFNHWLAPELWSNVQLNEPVHVQKYGLRCGILGLFPNIVASNPTWKGRTAAVSTGLNTA